MDEEHERFAQRLRLFSGLPLSPIKHSVRANAHCEQSQLLRKRDTFR